MGNRKFTKEFKLQILQELDSGKTTGELAREHELIPSLIRSWRIQYRRDPEHAFSGKGIPSSLETRNSQLERKVGQHCMEIDFVKRVNTNLQARLAELKKTR